MRPARARGRAAAFTLVELLVSVALVLTVLPVVMEVCSRSAALAGEARRRTEAAVLAEAELARLVVGGEWRRGEASGDFGAERPGFRWTLELGDHPRGDLRLLTLTVHWTGRGRDRALAVATLEPREENP